MPTAHTRSTGQHAVSVGTKTADNKKREANGLPFFEPCDYYFAL